MSNPFFSVIVPTLNGENRLPDSLGSVRMQSFPDYELIVVCDACSDRSAEVAASCGAKVILSDAHKDGLARNAGLDAATGDWILFLDDDDRFLHEYCFEQLAEQAGKSGEDILSFSFIIRGMEYYSQTPERYSTTVWSHAWRREFIGDERFEPLDYGSDTVFTRRMMGKCRCAAFWNMPMYYYNLMREGSLTWLRNSAS